MPKQVTSPQDLIQPIEDSPNQDQSEITTLRLKLASAEQTIESLKGRVETDEGKNALRKTQRTGELFFAFLQGLTAHGLFNPDKLEKGQGKFERAYIRHAYGLAVLAETIWEEKRADNNK